MKEFFDLVCDVGGVKSPKLPIPKTLGAAIALGFTPLQMMRKIILPQTMRMVIPPTGNQAIASTSVPT